MKDTFWKMLCHKIDCFSFATSYIKNSNSLFKISNKIGN